MPDQTYPPALAAFRPDVPAFALPAYNPSIVGGGQAGTPLPTSPPSPMPSPSLPAFTATPSLPPSLLTPPPSPSPPLTLPMVPYPSVRVGSDLIQVLVNPYPQAEAGQIPLRGPTAAPTLPSFAFILSPTLPPSSPTPTPTLPPPLPPSPPSLSPMLPFALSSTVTPAGGGQPGTPQPTTPIIALGQPIPPQLPAGLIPAAVIPPPPTPPAGAHLLAVMGAGL